MDNTSGGWSRGRLATWGGFGCAALLVASNVYPSVSAPAPRRTSLTTNASGAGSASTLIIEPESLDFGAVPIGGKRFRDVKVTNRGVGSVTLRGVSSTDSRFTAQPAFSRLDRGTSGRVRVKFTPTGFGGVHAELVLDFDVARRSVDLSGSGRKDPDVDGDGVHNDRDNCPTVPNADQADADGDGIGDPCDPCPHDPGNDVDMDGVCARSDNCPLVANPDQADRDHDGAGDACDNCPDLANADQADPDHDGIGSACDNCPNAANPDQADSDSTGVFVEELIDGRSSLGSEVELGDIDGDGDPDLVVAGARPGIVWRENRHALKDFGPQRVVDDAGAQAAAVGDIDGDRHQDIVAVESDGSVVWFPNRDGKGTFGARRVVAPSGANAVSPAIAGADLDGDGDLDVLVSTTGEDRVSWFENVDGVGSFGPARGLAATTAAVADLSAVDLDGDGDLDVLAASPDDNTVTWYENMDRKGTFSGPRYLSRNLTAVRSTVAADIDGDGDLDILAPSRDRGIVWFENVDGLGHFGAPRSVTDWAQDPRDVGRIRAADIDGDGRVDVLVSTHSVQSYRVGVSWFANTDGRGSFSGPKEVTTQEPVERGFAVADLDLDGDQDVVTAALQAAAPLAWDENTDERGAFERHVISAVLYRGPLAIADVDGDGAPDVLAWRYPEFVWYRSLDRATRFAQPQAIALTGGAPEKVVPFDSDGDGDSDLVAVYYDSIVEYENLDGKGSFGASRVLWGPKPGAGVVDAVVADIDGDGDEDIVAVIGSSYDGQVFALLNPGNSSIPWPAVTLAAPIRDAREIAVGDLDGDGDPDIAYATSGYDGGEVGWLENPGSAGGPWSNHIISPPGVGASSIALADLDGNGVVDVVAASPRYYQPAQLIWFPNLGATNGFGAMRVIETFNLDVPTIVRAADLDGDGNIDVIASITGWYSTATRLVWYANEATAGTFGPERVLRPGSDAVGLLIPADLNGTGRIDVVGFDSDLDQIFRLRNAVEGVGDACDNCPGAFNPGQADADGDGVGDACDTCTDRDHDGFGDPGFASTQCAIDTCPTIPNPSQADWDGGAFDPIARQVINGSGTHLQTAAVADIDGDGDEDVVYTWTFFGGAAWVENVPGAAEFGASHPITTSYADVHAAAAGDIDRDGDIDVVTAADDGIAWFDNSDGHGGFAMRPIESDTAYRIELVDVDGDGDLDVVAWLEKLYQVPRVSWFENLDGRGSFGAERVIGSAAWAPVLATGDLDGDGHTDVVTVGPDAKLGWLANVDGRGGFGPPQTVADLPGGHAVAVGDLDGDGAVDLVAAASSTYYQGSIVWFRNLDARGHFGSSQVVDSDNPAVDRIVAADLDGDGAADIVSQRPSDAGVVWYKNQDHRGLFSAARALSTHPGTFEPAGFVLADLDRDGDPDLVCDDENAVVWHRNGDGIGDACDNCKETFNPGQEDQDRDGRGDACDSCIDSDGDGFADPGTATVGCANDNCPFVSNPDQSDRDGDGVGDACDSCPNGGDFDGDGRCDGEDNCPAAINSTQTDFDGDGRGDACDTCPAVPNPDQADFDGLGAFGAERTVTREDGVSGPIVAADFDGDGDTDVVATANYRGALALFMNLDGKGTFGPRVMVAPLRGEEIGLAAADIDGDGDQDLLVAEYTSGLYLWFENTDSRGAFGPAKQIDAVAGALTILPADVDGDGDIDVVTLPYARGEIAWYENLDGKGTFGPRVSISAGGYGNGVRVGDIDGDGDLDVLAWERNGGKIAWFPNEDGRGTFGPPHAIASDLYDLVSVDLGDFDGDHDLDVFFASAYLGKVGWLPNTDGSGAFGSAHLIGAQSSGIGMAIVADIDKDGGPDVLMGGAWYRNLHDSGIFAEPRPCPGGYFPTLADLDGDGDLDEMQVSGGIRWFPNGTGDGVGDACDNCILAPNPDQADHDADGVGDVCDNCKDVPNPDQADSDGDGHGDACDRCNGPTDPGAPDADRDGVPDACDVCPLVPDPAQSDDDGDGLGNACDNCPSAANSDQADLDGDHVGDACDLCMDPDFDGFGSPGYPGMTCPIDNCPAIPNSDQADADGDGRGDVCDNCPGVSNPDQRDADGDGIGDLCDNCAGVSNPSQADADGDGIGDGCDRCTDTDHDGFGDPGYPQTTCPIDNCPSAFNPTQADGDGDGAADACDDCPTVWNPQQVDSDGDGLGDACDMCPFAVDPAQVDSDGDGVGDACDDCPVISDPRQVDADRDGKGDVCDDCVDVDFDLYGDPAIPGQTCPADNCPLVSNPDQLDGDGDGVGDACDNCPTVANADQADLDPGVLFQPQQIVSYAATGALAVVAADFDHDGRPDLVAALHDASSIVWYRNLGGGRFAPGVTMSTDASGAYSVAAADIDGDGFADVVSASEDDGKIAWYPNVAGLGFGAEHVVSTNDNSAHAVTAADLDGDGDLDLAVAVYYQRSIVWLENLDGAGTFSLERVIANNMLGAQSVQAADIDGDGDPDLLVTAQFGSAKIAWYENRGGGVFGPARPISLTAALATSATAADIDGDGDLDVVATSSGSETVAWYENTDGAGTFGPPRTISNASNGPQQVVIADLDGDGDADVVVALPDDSSIAWYENLDGRGSFGPRRAVTSADGAIAACIADFDQDGDLDVAWAAGGAGEIGWSPNGPGDGVGDVCDNCPQVWNPDQQDSDGDGIGDACAAPPARGTSLPRIPLTLSARPSAPRR